MTKAVWNNAVLAESDACKVVERNYYFPPDSINREYFRKSDKQSTCFWKGVASYFDIVVDGNVNKDAAWYYADPGKRARQIKDYIAFWKGVEITD